MSNEPSHWKICYHYFRCWARQGHWERIHDTLRDLVRLNEGKNARTAATLDSERVRTTDQSGIRGYDGGKKITGRKRHGLVDTMGTLRSVEITAAKRQDRDGERLLFEPPTTGYGWLRMICAGGGYAGALEEVA